MIIASPTPYGKSTLTNSPLAADGSDFPCKTRPGGYDVEGAINIMPVGVNQTLSFIGSAVHGGGSCQISLTSDTAPNKESKWEVIYSIMGGCPASTPGNFPEGTNSASTFEYSIPEDFAIGNYTLAWTWFNKVGNREMYMNCAPVTVTSASRRRKTLDGSTFATGLSKRTTYPPMFVANINNNCATQEPANQTDGDLRFPDPGAFVQFDGTNTLELPTGAGCAVAVAVSETSTGPAPSTVTAAPASTLSVIASAPLAPSSIEAAVISSAISSAVSSSFLAITTTVASALASATPLTPASAPSPSGSASTGSAGTLSGACATEGNFNCIGGTSFQQCASGAWSVVQPVAPGAQCAAGESTSLGVTKRNVRFSNSHLQRHRMRRGR
ncbi:hypothetical protein MMC18_006336 [Xylographa bjoerkii]|nr:hypothetical protein [Xylographa bjoerkii]